VKLGLLASHGGTTAQALIDACERGELDARISVLISNNSGSGAAERAQRHAIPFFHLSGKTHPEPDKLDRAILEALESSGVELVVLAGYMKKVGPRTLERYAGRILNTHPALLPKYGGRGMYGMHVHRAVIAAGERESGPSVHVVDGEYDHGPVLAQGSVPIGPADDADALAERVQVREKQLLVETLQRIATGALELPVPD